MDTQEEKTIYLLNGEWSTTDTDIGTFIDAYSTYENAIEAFNREVDIIKQIDYAHAFNSDGSLVEGYEMEVSETSFTIWKSDDYDGEHGSVELIKTVLH